MTDLSGLRVLVVEDEGVIAMLLEDMLETLGCEIAGSLARLEQAHTAASTVSADVALLDVNLNGQPVFPVAATLVERGIPFVFSTGYGPTGIPSHLASHPVLSKPYGIKELECALYKALEREG